MKREGLYEVIRDFVCGTNRFRGDSMSNANNLCLQKYCQRLGRPSSSWSGAAESRNPRSVSSEILINIAKQQLNFIKLLFNWMSDASSEGRRRVGVHCQVSATGT